MASDMSDGLEVASVDDELFLRAQRRVGSVLRGKYTLERVLGVGGMASVFEASHRNRNRVAVKVLHPELAVDSCLKDRFIREGYVANTVEHPGAVRILDDDVADDGTVFLVMELLAGETLDARWERSGFRLSVVECVPLLCELLDVLHAAHGKGIVHRDIKPENLFIMRSGQLKVLDFGIARLIENPAVVTRTNRLFGTPGYMAPEQALGRTREVDALSDIWAVGATAFTLLAGRSVHPGETAEEMVIRVATREAPLLSTVAPHVAPDLAGVIDRALSFKRAERWPTARAMREALNETAWAHAGPKQGPESTKPAQSEDVPPVIAPPDVSVARPDDFALQAPTTAPAAHGPANSRRRRASLFAGGVVAALMILGAVVGEGLRGRTQGPSVQSADASLMPTVVDEIHLDAQANEVKPATEPVLYIADAHPPTVAEVPPVAPPQPRHPTHAGTGAGSPRETPLHIPSAASAPASKSTAANCSPPYVMDSAGTKRWKVECL